MIQQKMIGDVLTSSILFEGLRDQYPDAELHYLIKAHTLPVVQGNPHIDHIVLDRQDAGGKILSYISFMMYIRSMDYDVVIDAYSKIGSALISFFSGARCRIGRRKWYTRFFYSQTIVYDPILKNTSGLSIQYRLQLGETLGLDIKKAYSPKIFLTNDEINAARNHLRAFGLDPNKKIVMISVLGSNNQKSYPLYYLAQILEIIVDNTDAKIIFNYIPKQINEVRHLLRLCQPQVKERITESFLAKNLREFIAVTFLCNALIGNEGGAIHIARAIETPTFAIYSPQIRKEAWSPSYHSSHKSVHLKDFRPDLFTNLSDQKQILRKNALLYDALKPALFQDLLEQFIQDINLS